jgi:DNA-binding SARP family transcriptional activator
VIASTLVYPSGVIIKGKLVAPDLPGRWVPRPRLAARLSEFAADHHVVWVCATAGSGKTTAVLEAVTTGTTPVAWLTLDASDRAPGHLLNYLEAALGRVYPDLEGVASAGLAKRMPHVEAAGLLADAIADRPIILVLDQLERLADASSALAVVAAFVRYSPRSLHAILCSRRELLLETHSTAAWADAIRVGEADLRFTVEEAREALALRGSVVLDAEDAVAATGGWVTGVLFESWRSEQHAYGAGGEADPLHGYLAAHILADLSDQQRDFLIQTSLCDEVNIRRSEALGVADAGARLGELRALHMPASWNEERRSLQLHPRLREFLLELLARRSDAEVTELRTRYVALLRQEGRLEEATDLLIEIGDLRQAVEVAEQAIGPVIERLDLTVASRWIAALSPHPGGSSQRLVAAELMVAVGSEDYARGTAVSDRLVQLMGGNVSRDTELATLVAMCYWHAERYEDADRFLAQAQDGPAARVLRWATSVEQVEWDARYSDEPAAVGGPVDMIPLRLHWSHGRLTRLLERHPSPWVEAMHRPWRIWALLALGRIDEAVALSDEAREVGLSPMFLDCFTRVELLLETGRAADAWREQIAGRDRVAATGSGFYKALHLALEAKLALRLRRDTDLARAALEQVESYPAGRTVQHVIDEHAVWKSLTLLLERQDEEAAVLLRATAKRLGQRDRLLQLPLIGIYLSEAEWRLGNEDRADDAADLALGASVRLGSHHRLLSALRDFPDVAARKIDAEADPISEWHRLGRKLLSPSHLPGNPPEHRVFLRDLGEPTLIIEGKPVRPRIAKSLELLAFLMGQPGQRTRRADLLDALFDGRADLSSRSYLRQAINRLREVLSDVDLLHTEGDDVWLEPDEFSSESQRVAYLLAAAGELPGDQQLPALREALALAEGGAFMEGLSSEWATFRRRELADLITDARLLAAEVAVGAGAYREAGEMATLVLSHDPYRESAWQLRMRVLNALGSSDALLATYRACEQALSDLGLTPSSGTQRLLEQLRR